MRAALRHHRKSRNKSGAPWQGVPEAAMFPPGTRDAGGIASREPVRAAPRHHRKSRNKSGAPRQGVPEAAIQPCSLREREMPEASPAGSRCVPPRGTTGNHAINAVHPGSNCEVDQGFLRGVCGWFGGNIGMVSEGDEVWVLEGGIESAEELSSCGNEGALEGFAAGA